MISDTLLSGLSVKAYGVMLVNPACSVVMIPDGGLGIEDISMKVFIGDFKAFREV